MLCMWFSVMCIQTPNEEIAARNFTDLLTFEWSNNRIKVRQTNFWVRAFQSDAAVTLHRAVTRKSPLFYSHFWPRHNASINTQQLPHEMDPLYFTRLATVSMVTTYSRRNSMRAGICMRVFLDYYGLNVMSRYGVFFFGSLVLTKNRQHLGWKIKSDQTCQRG